MAFGNAVGMADIVIGGFNPWILTPIEKLMNKTNLDCPLTGTVKNTHQAPKAKKSPGEGISGGLTLFTQPKKTTSPSFPLLPFSDWENPA